MPDLFVGKKILFQDEEATATITKVTEDSIFVSSEIYTGEIMISELCELIGIED